MNQRSKFREEENHDQNNEQHQRSWQTVRDFSSVEELLRHDAGQTALPDNLEHRLRQSVAGEAPRPWWKRFLKSKN